MLYRLDSIMHYYTYLDVLYLRKLCYDLYYHYIAEMKVYNDAAENK